MYVYSYATAGEFEYFYFISLIFYLISICLFGKYDVMTDDEYYYSQLTPQFRLICIDKRPLN